MQFNKMKFGARLFTFFYEYDHMMRQFCNSIGLYSGQPRILTAMSNNPGKTLSELSSMIGVGLPSLSVSIRSLKKAGLVRDNGAGRNRALYLTEEGMQKAAQFHEEFDKFIDSFIDSVGEERVAVFDAELSNMSEFFKKYTESI